MTLEDDVGVLKQDIAVVKNDVSWIKKEFEDMKKKSQMNKGYIIAIGIAVVTSVISLMIGVFK